MSFDAESAGANQTPATDLGDMPEQFGHFKLLRKLGEGGMGAVYLAEDSQRQQQVALKTPSFERSEDPQILRRFQREAQAAATLDHPNVCPLFEQGEIDDRQYLTMAFIEGEELGHWVERQEEIPTDLALRLVKKIARGLHAAHQAGLVHRDLKPGNIMITAEHEPVIMDFGMVRLLDVDETVLTPTGTMVGTPAYMAPEQIMAERDQIGPATDLYSLGVILYELLTGWPPFSGSLASMLGTIVSDPPPDLQIHSPDLPPALNQLCQRALQKRPPDRYQSGEELAQAIELYLSGEQVDSDGSASSPDQEESAEGSGGLIGKIWKSFRGGKTGR